MKRFTVGFAALIVLLGVAGHAFSGDDVDKPSSKELPGWAKLTSLKGEWETKSEDGKATKVKFELTAGGSALLETQEVNPCGAMITIYHADKDHLILTHYCCMGNQPRMKLKSATDKEIAFEFLDATNLEKPSDPHMHGLVIRFKDDDHYSEEWTFRSGDKDQKHVFEFSRKK